MSKVMTKKALRVVIAVVMLLSILTLTGCKTEDPYNDPKSPVIESDDGYFYIKTYPDQEATAIGITCLGQQQEVLAVPSIVQGYKVVDIGYQAFGSLWGPGKIYPLESNKLQKLYLPPAIDRSDIRRFKTPNLHYTIHMRSIYSFAHSYAGNEAPIDPNIIYYYNYEESPNQDLYWRDYVVEGGLYLRPEAPRRDGHRFGGWYVDSECTEEWNNQQPIRQEDELRLYAHWILE